MRLVETDNPRELTLIRNVEVSKANRVSFSERCVVGVAAAVVIVVFAAVYDYPAALIHSHDCLLPSILFSNIHLVSIVVGRTLFGRNNRDNQHHNDNEENHSVGFDFTGIRWESDTDGQQTFVVATPHP